MTNVVDDLDLVVYVGELIETPLIIGDPSVDQDILTIGAVGDDGTVVFADSTYADVGPANLVVMAEASASSGGGGGGGADQAQLDAVDLSLQELRSPIVAVPDNDYQIGDTDRVILRSGVVAASHTFTLPDINLVAPDYSATIVANGLVDETNPVLIVGDGVAIVLDGYAGTTFALNIPFGAVALYPNITDQTWIVVGPPVDSDVTLGGASPSNAVAPSQAAVNAFILNQISLLPTVTSSDLAKVTFTTSGSPPVTVMDVSALATEAYVTAHTGSTVTPAAQMQRVRSSLARAATAPVKVLVLGDSITEGVGASARSTRWINVLKDSLSGYTGYPSVSEGYIPVQYVGGVFSSTWTQTGAAAQTFGGQPGGNGLGVRSYESGTAATSSRSANILCDRFTLFYNKGPSLGAFDVYIDNVKVTSTPIDSYNATAQMATWDSGAITSGTHNIKFVTVNTGHNSTFWVSLAGVMPYVGNHDAGLQLYEGGHSGWPSYVPSGREIEQIALIQPDIVIFAFGTNDFDFGASTALTAANFTNAKAAIDFVTTHDVTFVYGVMWPKITHQADYDPRADAIRAQGKADGVVVVDFYADFGYQGSLTDLTADGTHPNDAGNLGFGDDASKGLTGDVKRSPLPSGVSTFGDADYDVKTTDRVVVHTGALTAHRSVNLPPAASVPKGTRVLIRDGSGAASTSNYLLVNHVGLIDAIRGNLSTVFLAYPYASNEYVSDGVANWDPVFNPPPGLTLTQTAVNNADYTLSATDRWVVVQNLASTARNITLPLANTVPGGTSIVVETDLHANLAGYALVGHQGSDTIWANFADVLLNYPYAYGVYRSDGTSGWYYLGGLTATQVGNLISTYDAQRHAFATVADANSTIANTTRVVVLTSALTATRTYTLPDSTAWGVGIFTFVDGFTNGTVSLTNKVQLQAAGSDAITNGAFNIATLTEPGGTIQLWSDGAGNWRILQPFLTSFLDTDGTAAANSDNRLMSQKAVNTRVKGRTTSTASSSTPTPNADTTDFYVLTALAANATFGAPTGTPVNGQRLVIRVKSDASIRTLAWNAAYRAGAVALPTATVASKTMYMEFMFNSADTKWDLLVSVGTFT